MSLHLIVKSLEDTTLLSELTTRGVLGRIGEASDLAIAGRKSCLLHGKGMSGDMKLLFLTPDTIEIPASDLNAAAAGEYTRRFAVGLVTKDTEDRHKWASFPIVLTPTKSTANAVGLVSLSSEPAITEGGAYIDVTFSTDEGVTPHVAGDWHKVQIQVAVDDKLFGYVVTPITITYNVI